MAIETEGLLSTIRDRSVDTEFYLPLPAGYKPGQTKYVVVVGTVMSGLGKGIFSSSLAKCLQDKGLAVAPIKFEGYLNIDSGTLNPYRHGEVFVLDDGTECDMDLGTYERALDQDLTKLNFCTSGQIFRRVLDRERHGGYLGRDVQMIPHVTGEVKNRLRELAVASHADVVFVEIGGTVGDVENAYYIEAMRQLAFEEGQRSVCFVALTYVMEPASLGEQKSKPAQLGIRELMERGIQPHIIACRAVNPVVHKVREKIALFSNVAPEHVISMHDCESVYLIPDMLRGAGCDKAVIDWLGLAERADDEAERRARETWSGYVNGLRNASRQVTIGVAGKYTSVRDAYASIIKAFEHAGVRLGARVQLRWIDTSELDDSNVAAALEGLHGLVVPGAFGTRGAEGKIACIRHARTSGLPCLLICYGFQMAVIEYARNVCGMQDANSTEIDNDCRYPVINLLPEQLRVESLGGTMRLGGQDVVINEGTWAWRMFGPRARQRFRHRYEVDPRYIADLEAAGLVFSGRSPRAPIMHFLELPPAVHPYFVGTQAHPELTSRPLSPHPFFVGLVHAALRLADPAYDQPLPFDAPPPARIAPNIETASQSSR
ncbi:MAG: CTP synthase [Phycisphaerae bacterium]|nr:CTP synthase [Phycisphaerae bacterium]MCZ2399541.1 CTP synthase [Phycisphaerae bacterium]NUQ48720.1 CTP synthase [Phycisphaerae bacterium]